MTQKEIILKTLAFYNAWIPSYKMRSTSTAFGWLGHQADRIARDLAHEGKIQRRRIGKYAEYHTIEKFEEQNKCPDCGRCWRFGIDYCGWKSGAFCE